MQTVKLDTPAQTNAYTIRTQYVHNTYTKHAIPDLTLLNNMTFPGNYRLNTYTEITFTEK
jgi:hypothetical protein